MGISKTYNCLRCHVYFEVTVEPDKDEETIRSQYPNSAEAIDKGLEACPFFCEGELEEESF